MIATYCAWLLRREEPWNTVLFGLARSAVALGILLTQLATPPSILYYRSASFPSGFVCGDTVAGNSLLLPCWLPDGFATNLTRIVSLVVLFVVVSGWRPRITALPFWYVTVSLVSTSPIPDGGDHLAIIFTTLILPISILDKRRWVWASIEPELGPTVRAVIARTTHLVFLVQIFFIYAHASLGKLPVAEWRDGTALWFWSRQTTFGFPSWLRELSDPLLAGSVAVAVGTYAAVLIEAFVALAALRGKMWRASALAVGVMFHLMIAIAMGLVSFFFSISAFLVVAYGPSLRSIVLENYGRRPRHTNEHRSLDGVDETVAIHLVAEGIS